MRTWRELIWCNAGSGKREGREKAVGKWSPCLLFLFSHDTTSRAAYDTNQSLNEPADSDDVCNIIDVCYSRNYGFSGKPYRDVVGGW